MSQQERPATNKDVELNVGVVAFFGFVFWLLAMIVLYMNLSTIRREATANATRELKAIQAVGEQVKAATLEIKERDEFFREGKPVPAINYTSGKLRGRWISTDPENMAVEGWGRLWKEETPK